MLGFQRPDQRNSESLIGPLLENFVISEVLKHLTWSQTTSRAYHYRDRDGREIDLLLESDSGLLVGLEVIAGATVRAEDFRHLRFLRDTLGDRFQRGIVLYSGSNTLHFGEGLLAVPIAALWG